MSTVLSRSNSDAGRQVDDQLWRINRRLHGSFAIGTVSQVRGELADVFLECMDADWDGHNALPVTYETYQLAERFLLNLPLGIRRPSIGAEPDGHLTLEWYGGVRRSVSVSIEPSGFVHYAALVGPEREYGAKVFGDSVPQVILDLIKRVS